MIPPNISPTMPPLLKKAIPPTMLEIWARLASTIASFMFIWTMFRQFIPYDLDSSLERLITNLRSYFHFHSYVEVTIHEYSSGSLTRSEAYTNIQAYLSSLPTKFVKRFMGEIGLDDRSVTLTMDDHERVKDEFRGLKVWWVSGKITSCTRISGDNNYYSQKQDMRFYKVTFHQKYRNSVTGDYLQHVVKQGKEIRVTNRQRKLHTNALPYYSPTMWRSIPFEHPATFDTIAIDSKKKREIMDDLVKFSDGKNFYARIGKPWKRGYLLYGPPGTGKSTMIAAMANLLEYDVYDVELRAVRDNTQLRRLLMETTNKSILVIEDIDCSVNLTSQRNKQNNDETGIASQVTLSGLLNAIDGIWSSCAGERVVVFTTNHVEKLDQALIRRGRMDKHIEMSYCGFEGFKVLAKNYLFVEEHAMFGEIRKLFSEVEMTPADVAENLMPKSSEEGADECLNKLVMALEEAKEVAANNKRVKEEEEIKG